MADKAKYHAIVVGASAGGLAALTTIFEKLPAEYPVPIIVVQHRAKNQRDLLEEVLQTKCTLKIKQADEKEKIKSGIVYIAPPDYHLLIEQDNTFSLASDEPVHYSRPSIDVLFESAVYVYRSKLLGVILTGANSDGARGCAAVYDAGGVTIAQNPGEALFPQMPTAAIATKKITHVFSLNEIGNYLLKLPTT